MNHWDIQPACLSDTVHLMLMTLKKRLLFIHLKVILYLLSWNSVLRKANNPQTNLGFFWNNQRIDIFSKYGDF